MISRSRNPVALLRRWWAKYVRRWEGETCYRCGRGYALVWIAEGDLWFEIVGTDGGLLCPDCFSKMAEKKGVFVEFIARDTRP